MADPVNPVDPAKPTGEGKSYLERMQKGMSNDPKANPEMAKEFADRLKKYVDEGKAINESRNEYKKVPGLTRVGGGGGGGGMGGNKLSNRDLTKAYKKGGSVSSASKRADGCAVKGKTKGRMV
jgi:hypothetical protein